MLRMTSFVLTAYSIDVKNVMFFNRVLANYEFCKDVS